MARSTKYSGPSITEDEAWDEKTRGNSFPVRVARPELGLVDRRPEGGEESSQTKMDGGGSTPSIVTPAIDSGKQKATPRKAARTTESRSNPTVADSDAASTDGVTQSKPQQQSDDGSARATVIEFDI